MKKKKKKKWKEERETHWPGTCRSSADETMAKKQIGNAASLLRNRQMAIWWPGFTIATQSCNLIEIPQFPLVLPFLFTGFD